MSGHYIENTGDGDMAVLGMFATNKFEVISLTKWIQALPRNIAMTHTNLSVEDLGKIDYVDTEFK
jgi:oxalate decarboxylase/phosphoglucose isomerase-like protein (cupin superfamily)